MHKSVLKVPTVLTFRKVSQKIKKSGGGSDLFWTESKLNLHFFEHFFFYIKSLNTFELENTERTRFT